MNRNSKISQNDINRTAKNNGTDARLLEAAEEITSIAGGDASECYDWLREGDWSQGGRTITNLADEWADYNNAG